ncbi:uncharacterized protein RNJ42_02285 [Nakaseomyces bracarensis]|uniref:uncharacterized protein n=1 Tax=Nakaseomyces bracarensis TaxID=273131 RepID=UPI0038720015
MHTIVLVLTLQVVTVVLPKIHTIVLVSTIFMIHSRYTCEFSKSYPWTPQIAATINSVHYHLDGDTISILVCILLPFFDFK